MTSWVATNRIISNGTAVEAGNTNQPIQDLIQRTDYLKEQLEAALAGSQITLRQQLVSNVTQPGTPVYFDIATQTYRPAAAYTVASGATFAPAPSTFWVGIATNVVGNVADIVMGGSVVLTTVQWAAVLEDASFVAGPVYLAENSDSPGKLNSASGTLGVYVGTLCPNGTLLVRLGAYVPDNDHIHIKRDLVQTPAGTVTDPAFGVVHTVNTPNPALRGWLPANSTYFPGFVVGAQIPTGAKFGYNIQHSAEAGLREIFPIVPVDNATVMQGGLILDNSSVIINNYGIWWMQDSYGNAPWPTDYAANGGGTPLQLWTTRLQGQSTLGDQVVAIVEDYLGSEDAESVTVTSVQTADADDLAVTGTGDNTAGFRGQVMLTNRGVTRLRPGRGIGVTAASIGGDVSTGYRGLLDVEATVAIPFQHIWTELLSGGDKVRALSTNGTVTGTYNNLRGHYLGVASTDYIDFSLHLGSELRDATYQPRIVVAAAVDTPSGTLLTRTVGLEAYGYINNAAVSSANLRRTATFDVVEGSPGVIQQVVVGPFADLTVQANTTLHIRIRPALSGIAVTAGTLRVLNVMLELVKV